MRIAFFANPLDNHDMKWINHLKKKHKCIIICNNQHENLKNHEMIDKIFPILIDPIPLNFIKLKSITSKINQILKENDIDVCHSMYSYPNAIWPTLVKFKNHVVTTRGSDILIDLNIRLSNGDNLKQKIIHFILRKLLIFSLNSAKKITSTSRSQHDALIKHNIDLDKLEVIRTGIDIKKLTKYLNQSTRSLEQKYFFSARSMKPIYNIELVLSTFQVIIKKYPEIKLVLLDDMGETDYASKIKNLCAELNLNKHVIFKEFISLEEMMSLYKYSEATIMVPHSDGTPNTGLEAMYSESTLVIGCLNYDSDIFNEKTCLKLRENTKEELAQKLEFLLENPNSYSIKDAKANVIDKASLEDSIQKINHIYSNLI
jgi:glycosyltransferase involved in cell wall biosynthesis